MDSKQNDFYAEALELSGYSAASLKAMCIWAYLHRRDKDAMRAASSVWNRNARFYARVAARHPEAFILGETLATDEYLILIELARLSEDGDTAYWKLTQEYTMRLFEIRDLIANGRKPREKKQTTCPKCGHSWKDGGQSEQEQAIE